MKRKIAFVVQRYGLDVNGGAEYHCRVLAEHLTELYDVEVLTTCARSYTPWDNFYDAGEEEINGVLVRRFSLKKLRDTKKYSEYTERMRKGDNSIEEEWITEAGPFCLDCIEFLKNNSANYAAILFFTYAYYLTVKGMELNLKNAILVPTAHDESYIYFSMYKTVFHNAKGILYNTIEEKEFVERMFDVSGKKTRVTCVGIDIPEEREYKMPAALEKYKGNYIIYVGRVSKGKNFRELNRDFMEYKKRNPSELKLIVVGRIDEGIQTIYSDDIIFAGFVTEEEKYALIQNSLLLVMPSKHESLSLVILESMALKRPVLVNGQCDVLKGQCIRSNAGLYYENYFQFEAALNFIFSQPKMYEQMCKSGIDFVKKNYDWEVVTGNVAMLIKELQEENIL